MSTTYTVTSDRLHLIKDGRKKTFYRGDPITGLSAEQVERFKSLNAIGSGDTAKVARDDADAGLAGPNPAETSDPDAVSAPLPTGITQPQASEIVAANNAGASLVKRPANAANKDVWVAYAVNSGQLTEDEANEASRNHLRDTLK